MKLIEGLHLTDNQIWLVYAHGTQSGVHGKAFVAFLLDFPVVNIAHQPIPLIQFLPGQDDLPG